MPDAELTFDASGIERIAQTLSHKVQSQKRYRQQPGRKYDHPPVNTQRIDLRGAFRQQRTEARLRGFDPEAKITQERFVENDRRDGQHQVNYDDSEDIRKDVAKNNMRMSGAERPAGIDKASLFQ